MHCTSTRGCWCDERRVLETLRITFQLLVCIILPVTFVYNIQADYTLEDHRISNPTTDKTTTTSMSVQTWAHAVDSRQGLLDALQSDTITAIETDLIMGFTNGATDGQEKVPIMAHPPNTHSDLSMEAFIDIMRANAHRSNKVIKLDFKEQETVEPTLTALVKAQLPTTIFLNADILPGPGRREPGAVTIDAPFFLKTCQKFIQHHQQQSSSGATTTRFAFSLGFKTMFADITGYTAEDVEAMTFLMDHYQLFQTDGDVGVVLALNARLLEKSLTQFDSILPRYPKLQLLVWTGKGEPPVPHSLIQSLQDHFEKTGMRQRIGYDCQVREDLNERN
jgi:Uncharacterized conserved protein (DUF2181)